MTSENDRESRRPARPEATPVEADEIVSAVLTASRVLVGVSARSLAEVEDSVTLTQFRALVVLAGQPEINLSGLAHALRVTASSAMRTVDRLVAADLAVRRENPHTRREVLLSLTPEGTRLVRKVSQRRRREIAGILDRMPTTRRRELMKAFRAFAEAADEPPPDEAVQAPLGW